MAGLYLEHVVQCRPRIGRLDMAESAHINRESAVPPLAFMSLLGFQCDLQPQSRIRRRRTPGPHGWRGEGLTRARIYRPPQRICQAACILAKRFSTCPGMEWTSGFGPGGRFFTPMAFSSWSLVKCTTHLRMALFWTNGFPEGDGPTCRPDCIKWRGTQAPEAMRKRPRAENPEPQKAQISRVQFLGMTS